MGGNSNAGQDRGGTTGTYAVAFLFLFIYSHLFFISLFFFSDYFFSGQYNTRQGRVRRERTDAGGDIAIGEPEWTGLRHGDIPSDAVTIEEGPRPTRTRCPSAEK